MLSSPSLLGAAVRHGLVPASDVRSGAVRVRPVSRSNHVHLVERDGTAVAYVKQSGAVARVDGDDVPGVEARVLMALADLELAPAPILQGGSGPVWMTPLPGVRLADITDAGDLRRAAQALGSTLARLHLHTVTGDRGDRLPQAPLPWPLLDSLPESMRGGEGHAAGARVLETVADVDVAAALRAARASWSTTHVIHGDISATNVLVLTGEGQQPDVRLLDFELGGWGAPELDLACAAGLLTDLSTPGLDLGVVLTDAYLVAGGPANQEPHWRCLRAVITAWQVAIAHGENALPVVESLLDRARSAAEQGRS